MILADISIKRAVFATMMILALLVLGVVSYSRLNLELFPNIDFPIVVVSTPYPGASAQSVETEVTKKVEDAVNTVAGIDRIESTSDEGLSQVLIWFKLEVKGQQAAQDVRDKVNAIRGDLPLDIEDPVIQRYDPTSSPVLSVVISGERSPRDLTVLVKDKIQKRLENVAGVGSVTLVGGYEREIHVELDLARMEAYSLSPFDIQEAIMSANFELPAGRMITGRSELLVRTMGKVSSMEELKNLVIDAPKGQFVKLADVATVTDGVKEQRSLARLGIKTNGDMKFGRAISLDIISQSGENIVNVADRLKAVMAGLKPELPSDIRMTVVKDGSVYTREAVNDVTINMIYGGILAVITVFLFLANIRSTIITAIAIPVSVISTFTFMNALGFTLNFLTLMGLSLAVGFLIDDAIVVVENIYRHLAMGKNGAQASSDATQEIGMAVAATTFTIVVVFLPVSFMKGIVGRFFFAFGLTVAFAVLVSLFVSFTLTPMLSSRFLKAETSHRGSRNPLYMLTNLWNGAFNRLNDVYKGMLAWSLNHRPTTMLIAIASFVVALLIGPLIGFEFMPTTDQSEYYVGFQTAPESSLEQAEKIVMSVEEKIASIPEAKSTYATIGSSSGLVNQGSVYVQLVPLDKRKKSAAALIEETRKKLKDIPGAKFSISMEESHGGNFAPVEIAIRGESEIKLQDYTERVEKIVLSTPGCVDVDNTLTKIKPEVQIIVDREKAADLGINLQELAMAVRMCVNGEKASRFRDGDEEYDILVRLQPDQRNGALNLERFRIPSHKDIEGVDRPLFPLSRVAQFVSAGAAPSIERYDRLRIYRVTANVAGRFAGNVREDVTRRTDSIAVSPGYSIKAIGESQIQNESFGYMFEALALAVVFIYLILASQYNHFIDPLAIMVSLPLSLIGAFLGLLLFGSAISIIAMIGVILLMGLVTKNAILLIDFVKQRRARGTDRAEAILEAGPIRLRPILMTSMAMVFGMLPLALGIGPGAELRAPIARAVVGGVISSTLLTLIVVPVVYTLLDDLIQLPAKWWGGKKVEQLQET